MDGFQPRIEEPPSAPRERASKYERVRSFVMQADGRWCLIAELPNAKQRDRNRLRSTLFAALMRRKGYQKTGFDIHSVQDGKTYKVYARYLAANVVKNSQPQPLTQEPGSDAR